MGTREGSWSLGVWQGDRRAEEGVAGGHDWQRPSLPGGHSGGLPGHWSVSSDQCASGVGTVGGPDAPRLQVQVCVPLLIFCAMVPKTWVASGPSFFELQGHFGRII